MQDPRGVTSLNLLERALSEGDTHAFTYFAFDLCPTSTATTSARAKLIDRKAALAGLVDPLIDDRSPVQLSEHVEGDGEALFAQASRMGLEGIVSKKADARYVQARSASWLKVKRVEVGTFVVIGFLSNMPSCASSLMLAEERDGELVYACRAGSGISDDKAARTLRRALEGRARRAGRRPAPTHAGRPLGRARVDRRDRLPQPLRRPARRARRCSLGFAPRQPTPRRASALKPKLVGDRDLAAITAHQSRARDLRRQRRHQARPGALLRPRRRLAAAGAAAPAGDDVPLPDRRLQGLLLPAPRLRRPAAGRRDRRAGRRGGSARPSSPSPSRRATWRCRSSARSSSTCGAATSTIPSIRTGWSSTSTPTRRLPWAPRLRRRRDAARAAGGDGLPRRSCAPPAARACTW